MARTEADIFIAGAGIAGLTAALAFSRAGFSVTLAAPHPPVTEAPSDGSDLRSTAFLQPAKRLFEEIGLWAHLDDDAVPLEGLQIVDAAGHPPQVRDSRAFRAEDLELECFGWNLINWRVSAALMAALADTPGIDLRLDTAFAEMLSRDTGALVRLSSGDSVAARLVIGADGRDSAVRAAAGIEASTIRYGQKALAFTVSHAIPHGNVSTEIYHEGGPFTLVPLPESGGRPASAVVWMNPGPRALELAAMPTEAFEAEMSARSCHHLGPLTLTSPRRVWPIVTRRAARLVAERTALMAEAAHVVPPIGAQGLNTSLNDLIALRDLAAEQPAQIGTPAMLARYERARLSDITARVAAIDMFNRVTRSGRTAVQALRLGGLRTVYDVRPLRQAVMRAGMAG